jgi:hypothetical protein
MCNEKLHDLHSLPNTIQVIKSRRREEHVAHTGVRKQHTGCWWGNLRERDHLEDLGIDGRIILKRIFLKWDWRHGLD